MKRNREAIRYESQIPPSEYWNFEIDLNRDIASLMYDSLKRRGISKAGQRDPVYEYFNYMKRTIGSGSSSMESKSNCS